MSIIMFRTAANALKNNLIPIRVFSTTKPTLIKEIHEKTEKSALIIEGVELPSPREGKLIKEACQSNFCPECTLGLNIKHTDVLILSQFVRSDGCMLPRRITKLCHRQQKRIGSLVTMAQKAGLMINLTPSNGVNASKKDPKKRYGFKKFNKYFDETTIRY